MNNEPIAGGPPGFQASEGQVSTEPVKELGAVERITGMFFEPGKTFQAIKARPTWLVAFLVIGLFTIAFTFVYTTRIPAEVRAQAQLDRMMKTAERFVTDEAQLQRMREEFQRRVKKGETVSQRLIGVGTTLMGILALAAIGAALYFLGVILMGKRMTFKQALAVRIYSDLPPGITAAVLMIILMYVKSPDQIDPVNPASILTSNLGSLVNGKEHIVLGTIASNIDLFQFWALILSVIGLTIMPEKMKRGQAIGIVIVVWLLGLLLKIGLNVFTGGLGL